MPTTPTNHHAPVLYIPHGGGPLPLLNDPQHASLNSFLSSIVATFARPAAIVVISAHWETSQPTITSAAHPQLIYDYSGFPQESYAIRYDADGDPHLAHDISTLLHKHGQEAQLDSHRGFDHGLFVPLTVMYPAADIPCVQISLLNHLDPTQHITVGKALSALREKNILIIGSGMSFHNMHAFFSHDRSSDEQCAAFDTWLKDTCANPTLSTAERETRLINWPQAPAARFCHPRSEHLLPLHVCFGIASATTPVAKTVFNDEVLGKKTSAFLWH